MFCTIILRTPNHPNVTPAECILPQILPILPILEVNKFQDILNSERNVQFTKNMQNWKSSTILFTIIFHIVPAFLSLW